MIAPGQPIEKSQLDSLAALANAKLPNRFPKHLLWSGVDPAKPNQDFVFLDSGGWKSELWRIRANLNLYHQGLWSQLGRNRPGAEHYISGPWPVGYGTGILVFSATAGFTSGTKLYNALQFLSRNSNVTFSALVKGNFPERTESISAYCTPTDSISTQTIYRYDLVVPSYDDDVSTVTMSPGNSFDGIWFIKVKSFSPNMNPLSSEAPWIHYDERISRFASTAHRAMSPYAELPAPYPPAKMIPETSDFEDYYEGLADYNFGMLRDIRGPHSPSKSSYFRIPSYPTRKKADGEYNPFSTESVAGAKDFGWVILYGMIYSVTLSRPTFDSDATFILGNFIGGAWQPILTETLSAGERSKTIYPTGWLVMNDCPIYYDGPADCNVTATFIGRGNESFDVQWPIHSCYYNDTAALLNAL